MPRPVILKSWSLMVLWRPTNLLYLTPQKDVLFIIGDWNAKVGSQETSGITANSALEYGMKQGQRLIEFCQENTLIIADILFQQHKRRLYTWTSPDGRHWNQTDFTLCSQNGEVLYSQQKQDRELTVDRIMNSLLANSDWNWRMWRQPLDNSGMT